MCISELRRLGSETLNNSQAVGHVRGKKVFHLFDVNHWYPQLPYLTKSDCRKLSHSDVQETTIVSMDRLSIDKNRPGIPKLKGFRFCKKCFPNGFSVSDYVN